MSAIVVELPLMVDLAVGTPQVGAVNFNILHSLLHVMVQQLNLTDTLVELRGPTSDVVGNLLKCQPPAPILTLSEYELKGPTILAKGTYQDVTKGPEKSKDTRKSKADERPESSGKESASSELAKKGKRAAKRKRASLQKLIVVKRIGEDDFYGPANKSGRGGPTSDGVKPMGVVSSECFGDMECRVTYLEEHLRALEELPSNKELLEAVRSGSSGNPVTEMWNTITMMKRIEAAEEVINKLTSMMEDLAKEYSGGTSSGSTGCRLDLLEARVYDMENKTCLGGISPKRGEAPRGTAVPPGGNLDQIVLGLKQEVCLLKKDVADLFARGAGGDAGGGDQEFSRTQPCSDPEVNDRLTALECRMNFYTRQTSGLDSMVNDKMEAFANQLADVEKEVGIIMEKFNSDSMSAIIAGGAVDVPGASDGAGIGDLYEKIDVMQGDMDQINNTASRLMREQEERQIHINALLEQIEFLKTVKADKEDLEDALADKADHHLVNRKVSHDQFDAACDDLSRGLEEALIKLTTQESLWQQALDDVQREIENKLDKIEISPLKDFVNNKLKALQERLKALANLKKDTEAAGTKLRLLRNVNCISCDADVVMCMDERGGGMTTDALPAHMSMKPYLTYELDQVRKQQRVLPATRDMNNFERAVKEERKRKKPHGSADHLCSRYCGGSHTITTAHQRVTRMGHFLTQWGPEAIQLTEGAVKGTDGKYYKTRDDLPPCPGSESDEAIPVEEEFIKIGGIVEAEGEGMEEGEGEVCWEGEGEECWSERRLSRGGSKMAGSSARATVGGARATTFGGARATTVGGPRATTVGGPRATTVGGPRATTAGGSARATTVGEGARATTVGGPRATTAGGSARASKVGGSARASTASLVPGADAGGSKRPSKTSQRVSTGSVAAARGSKIGSAVSLNKAQGDVLPEGSEAVRSSKQGSKISMGKGDAPALDEGAEEEIEEGPPAFEEQAPQFDEAVEDTVKAEAEVEEAEENA